MNEIFCLYLVSDLIFVLDLTLRKPLYAVVDVFRRLFLVVWKVRELSTKLMHLVGDCFLHGKRKRINYQSITTSHSAILKYYMSL